MEETTSTATEEEKVTWTTWEELLLACAVKRHGLKDWDSVAMELQSRRSCLPSVPTPQICKTKFLDLRRRFMAEEEEEDEEDRRNLNGGDIDSIPWLEELRKLRVAELKQEVHRYDLSIQSLQLKVKRLEEERENSLKVEEHDGGSGGSDGGWKPDLVEEVKEDRSENDKKGEQLSPADLAPRNSVSGEDSDRSFNESKSNSSENGAKEVRELERVESGKVQSDSDSDSDSGSKPFCEDSCNDSSGTIAKHKATKTSQEKCKGTTKGGESAELRDSAAESKEGTKECSDVQSSASLTNKKQRRREVSGVSGGEDEPVVVSPTVSTKRESSVKSEPLVAFLDIIRSHKHGSLFERRLESQKTEKYKKLIRQHVDLEMVKKRIENGSYSSCTGKFYLDLLLIFNNAIVFYPRSSSESKAAYQLRALVSKELKKKQAHHSNPSPESTSNPVKPKPEPQRSDSLLAKHKLSAPIVMCRRRSSISAKSTSLSKEQKRSDTKPILNSKQPVKSPAILNKDESSMKLQIKPVTGARSMRRCSQSRTNSNTQSKNQNVESSSLLTSSDHKGEAQEIEKKKTDVTPQAKKRVVADFLKRIKKGSVGKVTPPGDKLKSSSNDLSSGRRDQTKKKPIDEQKDGGMKKGFGKMVKEEGSPSKRTVGRLPRKGTDKTPVKRGRESGGGGGAYTVSNRPKKRTRR